ncbi:hypothetical protein DSECCO2_589840 [anaerobic digester metagenome]
MDIFYQMWILAFNINRKFHASILQTFKSMLLRVLYPRSPELRILSIQGIGLFILDYIRSPFQRNQL